MTIDPDLRVYIANGRFDSLRSRTNTEENLKAVDPKLRSRITFRCFDSGHGFFINNPAVVREFNADIRALIAGGG